MHGNPWLRLLRREVGTLARARHGDRYVSEQQARVKLTRVNREIRRLRTELAELEERRAARLRSRRVNGLGVVFRKSCGQADEHRVEHP
jgi:hypothetical protein